MLAAVLLAATGALDHSQWDALLKKYVTPESRVRYEAWKRDGTAELDKYVAQFAAPWPAKIDAAGTKAALINAYNASVVHWILERYPVRSIWKTPQPFTAERHTIDGKRISLDGIEARLRAMGDPRIHAALVCAARSCPPLRREAYVPERIDHQLDANTRTWLANTALNRFTAAETRVSMIFKWYANDFAKEGGVRQFLSGYGPNPASTNIQYLPYNWGLNDDSPLGSDYSQPEFIKDRIKSIIH